MEYGHWECEFEFVVDDYFGFIYRVTDLTNDMEYLGRKQFHSHLRKKVKGRKNRKKVVKECKWREYTTSSRMINELIAEHGLPRFKFEIIELCETKGQLSYREVELQWAEEVLSATLPNGDRKYYNGQIGAIKFRCDRHTLAARAKMKGNTNATGCKRSLAFKQKCSNRMKGTTQSESTKKKLSNFNKETEASQETKDKIGAAHKGKTTSTKTKDKMREAALKRNSTGPIQCEIDGVVYNSVKSASETLGISTGVCTRRLKSSKYPDYIVK